MEKKEFAVGEEFQMGLKRLKCIEHHDCHGCIFEDVNWCDCIGTFTGECNRYARIDKTDVIFVEVE